MSSLKNQDTLTILTYLSRKNLKEQELLQILGEENQASKLVIEQLLKEEIIQLNNEGAYFITGKGLKSARHLFEKPPHLRGKMKSKSTKRRGFIQLAILQLLKEEPRHGYQVMKLLEERSDGFYLPSAGTIYPALQDLHDKELISVDEQADKKVYSLNSNGLEFLSEMIHDGDDIFWEQWRLRLMWKQSKEAVLVREEMEKYHLEFLYAMRSIMHDPSLAGEVVSIIKNGREQLINWSEQQERKRDK
ncbi:MULTISPECIES: PadR family transcriptional regulator [Metabacillus]|jgi:DNA-binding PadR family transcriptional regulator|uniref:PadR family transcriptional regulator n=1 Tax=Metabacillus rhizolycopersici TaxID=2875709 RepID=A0ABS7V0F0_9BACI|nr:MULTISPECIES: PadR family transcriptional regulator [Metabacillus]MBZ5753640.1 PadR family transcriptional regulator [Metabacillus rhizolycopersici]MCM3652263.1 PadR family transcriptional regulator [Metabacillus litoralis]